MTNETSGIEWMQDQARAEAEARRQREKVAARNARRQQLAARMTLTALQAILENLGRHGA